MREQEWLECADPQEMLEFLRARASERKARQVAAGCCRRIWNLLTDERLEKAVEVAEVFADGLCDRETIDFARTDAAKARSKRFEWWNDCVNATVWAAYPSMCADHAFESAAFARLAIVKFTRAERRKKITAMAESAAQAGVIRDLFGPLPFRAVVLDPGWLTSTVVDVAQAIYNERTIDRLPILGDALEDAGCSSQNILNHCRQPGVHVRGCWALDVLLGKE